MDNILSPVLDPIVPGFLAIKEGADLLIQFLHGRFGLNHKASRGPTFGKSGVPKGHALALRNLFGLCFVAVVDSNAHSQECDDGKVFLIVTTNVEMIRMIRCA